MGLGGTLRSILAGTVEGLQLRLELFGIELQQEKRTLFLTVFAGLAAALLLFTAMLLGTLALVAVFWEQRVAVLLGLAAIYLVLGASLVAITRQRLVAGPRPFSATLEELKKDQAMLRPKQ